MSEELAFEVGIAIVLTRSMMTVFRAGAPIYTIGRGILLQPVHDVSMKAVFKVVDIDGGGDVHGVDQNQSIGHTGFTDDALDLISDAANLVALGRVDVDLIGVGQDCNLWVVASKIQKQNRKEKGRP